MYLKTVILDADTMGQEMRVDAGILFPEAYPPADLKTKGMREDCRLFFWLFPVSGRAGHRACCAFSCISGCTAEYQWPHSGNGSVMNTETDTSDTRKDVLPWFFSPGRGAAQFRVEQARKTLADLLDVLPDETAGCGRQLIGGSYRLLSDYVIRETSNFLQKKWEADVVRAANASNVNQSGGSFH